MSMTTTTQKYNVNALDPEKVELIKRTICKGANNDQLELFLHTCEHLGLDPFLKQVYAVFRGGQMTIQTSIDGYRLIADRTGKYMPGRENTYTYDDKNHLISATAYVKKLGSDGQWHEVAATAFWDEYVVMHGGKMTSFWEKMPHSQLGKCAESLAIRKAFPSDLSSIRTSEEMEQAGPVVTVNRDTGEIIVKAKISKDQERFLLEQIGDDKDYLATLYKFFNVRSFTEIDEDKYEAIAKRVAAHNQIRLDKELNTQEEAVV